MTPYDLSYQKQNGKTVKVYRWTSDGERPAAASGTGGRQAVRVKKAKKTIDGSVSSRDAMTPQAKQKTDAHPLSEKQVPAKPKKKEAPIAAVHVEPHVLRTVRDTRRTPFPIGILLTAALCTVLFMYMIYHFVQINEYTLQITSLQNTLSSLQEQEKELSLALDKRNDLRLIEQKAEELGMVKLDQVSKQYVKIHSEEKIEVIGKEEQEDASGSLFDHLMSAIARNWHHTAE